MHVGLAGLRYPGALGLGLILGVSAVVAVGAILPGPAGPLLLVIIYAAIGAGILTVASPSFGVFLVLGWAAPWLLVGWVAATDLISFVPFPAIVTAVYVLSLCIAFYRAGHRR